VIEVFDLRRSPRQSGRRAIARRRIWSFSTQSKRRASAAKSPSRSLISVSPEREDLVRTGHHALQAALALELSGRREKAKLHLDGRKGAAIDRLRTGAQR